MQGVIFGMIVVDMIKPFLSLYIQTIYAFLVGITFLTLPNKIFKIFGVPTTKEYWVFFIGLLALSFCFYYFQIARFGNAKVVMSTVYGRLFFTGSVIIFAFLDIFPKQFVGVMVIEASLAIWSWKEVVWRK